jgi:DinB superfamily
MEANPYARFVAGQDPISVIRSTPGKLASLAQQLGTAGLARSTAPGKWTAAEILAHLADVEIAFSFRLRQAQAEPHHTIQPFDQDAWAIAYSQLDTHAAIEAFTALRRWNLAFISALPAAAHSKQLTHPERGAMTFQTLLETMAGHDNNHILQLEAIANSN